MTGPGLHISRKDRKHVVADTLFKLFSMLWSPHSCNDRRYSYFTRNICNRCIYSLKILCEASSEACSAIVTTIWRPSFIFAWEQSFKQTKIFFFHGTKTKISFDAMKLSRFCKLHLRTTVPFVTAHLEIFHCTHHPVIPMSDFYFTFCSALNALSRRTSK